MNRLLSSLAACSLALAGFAPAGAEGFGTLRVAATTALDGMIAGPANSALLLSPDGGRLVHLAAGQSCLHDVAQGTPAPVRCDSIADRRRGIDGLSWSPDGARLTWPDRQKALMEFRDSDIAVLDPVAMRLSVLTDDGYDGPLAEGAAVLDLAAGWRDAGTVLFVRHPMPAEGETTWPPASLLAVTLDGTTTELLPAISKGGIASPLAVGPGGETVAIYLDDPARPEASGLLLYRIGEAAPRLLAPKAAVPDRPVALAFSADGRFIVITARTPEGGSATLIDVATGVATPVRPHDDVIGVGWSPAGAALTYLLPDDPAAGTTGGLYIAEPPDAPGRLLLPGDFMPPHCCTQLLDWARNDTMVLGNTARHDQPLLVRFVR